MINKLPRWVAVGGFVLAFIGGMVNAAGFLGYRHQALTHMTGTTSLFGIAIGHGDGAELWHLGMLLLAFVLGAALSGLIVGHSVLRLGRRYGVALALESMLLCAAVALLRAHADAGLWLASAACGLQNAMAGTFSGAVVRTTHVSGIVTDLGTYLGHWLRGITVDTRRTRLYLILFSGFLCGGLISALAFPCWAEYTLLLPAALTGIIGIGYTVHRHCNPPPMPEPELK